MGRDKALLELGGQPLVLHTAEKLRPVVSWLALVGAPERYGHLGLPVLADPVPGGRGPLGGIVAALGASEYDWNLVVACDLPYLETRFLEFLLTEAGVEPETDAVVPRIGERWEPLCASYHRRCLAAFEQALNGEDRRIVRAFETLRVREVGEEEMRRFAFGERMFKNMNLPEEYEEAKRGLGG